MSTNRPANVIDALNIVLADAFALYLKTKNFHWHVTGPHFRDYHLLLDEQSAQILAATDLIAERIRKLGGATLRSIGHVGRLSEVADIDADQPDVRAMLDELHADTLTMIADAAGDNASSGVIDTWTDEAERRAWFLTASLGT